MRASPASEWTAGIAAACKRLVHPTVEDADERARQGRFLGVTLVAPFFAAAATAQMLSSHLGAAITLASVCALFGAAWLVAFTVVVSASRRAAHAAALVLGAAVVAVTTAAAGGALSPLAVMAGALVVEAIWVCGTRKAAAVGLAAAVAAIAASVGLSAEFFADAATPPSAWHWVLPALYATTLWARFSGSLDRSPTERGEDASADPQLEEMIDAVVLRMRSNGEVTQASAQALTQLHLAPDMLLGPGFFDRIHVADRVEYLCAQADLREGAASRTLRLRLRMPAEGDAPAPPRYGHFTMELMRAQGSDTILAVVRSDAECAELELALADAREAAAAAERSRSQFVAAMSHELRAPLNAILGFSDVLRNEMFGTFADERQGEYVGLIHDAGSHLLSVLDALLDVSKVELGAYEMRPETFAFGDAVRLCLSLTARPAAAKAVTLTSSLADDVGPVTCDRRALQQILINLVGNAVKFTPAGGRVVLSARRQGGRLAVEVIDTGIGMAPQELAQVGKPFVQVKNDYTRQCEGSGLGLALVKSLVGLLDGEMTIESAPNAGTRVVISLPVAEDASWRDGEKRNADRAVGPDSEDEWNDEAIRKTA